MRHHDQLRELLPDLAAGDLRADDERRLRRHLEGCDECAAWLETWSLFSLGLSPTGSEPGHPSSHQLARMAADRDLLAPSELEALEGHLRTCEECRGLVTLCADALQGGERRRLASAAARWLSPAALPLPVRVAVAAGLILAVALVFMPRQPPEVVATADDEIVESILTGRQVIETDGSISARAMIVESGGEVTLRAGGTVLLENGSSVASGASLEIVAGRPMTSRRVEPAAEAG